MGFFLGVLLLMWAGIAATFVLPGFREMNHFKALDVRGRLRRSGATEAPEPHHVHAEPHAEIRTLAHEVVAPAPRVAESAPRRVAASTAPIHDEQSGMVFDTWSNKWVNFEGEVVTPGSPTNAPMNPRAEAYRRARPEVEATAPRRPMAPSANGPISPSRKAALRRRKVLKYMVIAISMTTVPAVLTSWSIFVASAVFAWLSFVTWFSIMVRQFVTGELGRQTTAVTPPVFDALPDNVIALRRPATVAATEVDDEFFDPRSVGGFARAQFAVGE